MPSRKQRRQREKLQRHEYEYVLETDDGEEVIESPRAPEGAAPKNGKPAKEAAGPLDRHGKPIQKPSIRRVLRRTAIFVPLIALFLYVTADDLTIPGLIVNVARAPCPLHAVQLPGRHGRLPHALAPVREGARREARALAACPSATPEPAPGRGSGPGPGQGASRRRIFAPASVADGVALVRLEASSVPAGASTASPPARKVTEPSTTTIQACSLTWWSPSFWPGLRPDEHRARLVLAAEDDRRAAPARRLDLGETPGLHRSAV